jgi:RNA polymerase nonessential primary-like sigma factor
MPTAKKNSKSNVKRVQKYEEHAIARAYFSDVSKVPLLNQKQERRYSTLAQKGSKRALDKMINSNLRLVITIALRYLNRGVHLLDLVSEGNFGLIRAVEKFDPKRGFRFSTYATWWIRQSVERSIGNQARLIRIPGHILHQLYTMRKVENIFKKDNKRSPNMQELAELVDSTEHEVQVKKVLTLPLESLNLVVNESGATFGDKMKASKQDEPEKMAEKSDTKRYIQNILNELSPIQKEVICMRFGLMGHTSSTLEFIAQHIGKTRERVRQIQLESIDVLNKLLRQRNSDQDLAS